METELGGLPINDNDSYTLATDDALPDDNRTALGITKSYRKTPYNSRYFSQNVVSNNDVPDHAGNDEHKLGLHDLFGRLLTDPMTGLMLPQVRAHTELYGLNEIGENLKVPEWVRFCKNLFGGSSLILWVGSLLCFVEYSIQCGNMRDPSTDSLYMGLCLLVVLLITGSFSYYQEFNQVALTDQYQRLVPRMAMVLRAGEEQEIPAEEVVLGDIILIRGGDFIPADARVLECSGNFLVDNSAITGESEPQERDIQFTHDNILLSKNMVFCSTYAVQGFCKAVVIRTGVATVLGQMAEVVEANPKGGSQKDILLSNEISNFIQFLSAIAVALGTAYFVFCFRFEYLVVNNLYYTVGIIVAVIPGGLLAVVTMSLSITAKRLHSRNCFVKNVEAVETLGATSIILTDKTGTLTKNSPMVAHVWFDEIIGEIDTAVDVKPQISFDDRSETWKTMARAAVLCSGAEFTSNSSEDKLDILGSPIDSAVLKVVEGIDGQSRRIRSAYPKVTEIPFNSIIKFQLSIHECNDPSEFRSNGYLLTIMGDPDVILKRCGTILLNGRELSIDDSVRNSFEFACRELGSLGERLVALADFRLSPRKFPPGNFEFKTQGQINFPLTGFRLLGIMSMMDPPRPSVPDSISKCQASGIKVIMMTGDNVSTAKAIAKSVGILEVDENGYDDSSVSIVVSGEELDSMSEDELRSILVYHREIVFYSLEARHKLILVQTCKEMGAVVAVTGDGVNDAPALRNADIGIAMGISGSAVAKESADMILADDNFASIVIAVEEGRLVSENIKKIILYLLTSNVPQLGAFILFILAGIPLPLGALGILILDLGTNILPAITLTFEEEERDNDNYYDDGDNNNNNDSDLMKRGPRNPIKDKIVSEGSLFLSIGQYGLFETGAGFFTYFVIMAENGFWPSTLYGIRRYWNSKAINDLQDEYGQEWTFNERTELEYSCQTGFLFSVLTCQWIMALTVCRSYRRSVFRKGWKNWPLNFAVLFETVVIAGLIYVPGVNIGLGLRYLNPISWFTVIPSLICILLYDEVRKAILRRHRSGWMEKETMM